MDSERLERYKDRRWGDSELETIALDFEFADRIRLLLDHPDIDKYCMVDAYYYDFSVLPSNIANKCFQDMYMIYGITTKGEMISRWVKRYDLDSDKPPNEVTTYEF